MRLGATEVVTKRPTLSPFRATLTVAWRRAHLVWTQIYHSRNAMAGLVILLFFTVLAVAGPWIAPYGPMQSVGDTTCSRLQVPATYLQPPCGAHPLGTNYFSDDIYSQVIWGTQISFIVGIASAVVAKVGVVDLTGVILVIGLTGWSVTARVIRTQVLSIKERMFVERAKMIGTPSSRILLRHIFPNAFPLIFANTILTIAISILSESVLAFLGLRPPDTVSWGRIIAEAIENDAVLYNAWWLIIPGLCIVFLVFGFYLFGYALDEILNPRLRRR